MMKAASDPTITTRQEIADVASTGGKEGDRNEVLARLAERALILWWNAVPVPMHVVGGNAMYEAGDVSFLIVREYDPRQLVRQFDRATPTPRLRVLVAEAALEGAKQLLRTTKCHLAEISSIETFLSLMIDAKAGYRSDHSRSLLRQLTPH